MELVWLNTGGGSCSACAQHLSCPGTAAFHGCGAEAYGGTAPADLTGAGLASQEPCTAAVVRLPGC